MPLHWHRQLVSHVQRGDHGIHHTGASRRRSRHLANAAGGFETASGHPALGGAWLRYPVRDLSAVCDQDGRVRGGRCRGHLADTGAGRARSHRGVVDAADRVSEVRHLHPAVRGLGIGLWIRPARREILAADRRVSLLVAAQDDSSATVAQRGSVHQRRYPHHRRCRPLRPGAGFGHLGAAVTRPWRVGHRYW